MDWKNYAIPCIRLTSILLIHLLAFRSGLFDFFSTIFWVTMWDFFLNEKREINDLLKLDKQKWMNENRDQMTFVDLIDLSDGPVMNGRDWNYFGAIWTPFLYWNWLKVSLSKYSIQNIKTERPHRQQRHLLKI